MPSSVEDGLIKVEFAHQGESPSDKVLKAWRSQNKFVRLEDDTLVRLPTEWLKEYGVVLEEIESFESKTMGNYELFGTRRRFVGRS